MCIALAGKVENLDRTRHSSKVACAAKRGPELDNLIWKRADLKMKTWVKRPFVVQDTISTAIVHCAGREKWEN